MSQITARKSICVLIAEDDEDDRMLTKKALEANGIPLRISFVDNGEELMDYLNRNGVYTDPGAYPWPDLILLDLNMPRKNGREALQEIKQDPRFRRVPVVVLTTSKEQEDIVHSYDLGANSYITKPVTFEGLVRVLREMLNYWFNVVQLPGTD